MNLKSKLANISVATVLVLISTLVALPPAQATTYAFGDTGPAGGKIFLTPSSSGNTTGLYFEVAPVIVSAPRYLWCNSSDQTIPGANGTAIGTGKTNTQAMLDHGCTSGAGFQASQYSAGGFTDWFLPSSGEVVEAQKLYGNGLYTGVGLDNGDIHWTSTWVNSSASYIWYPYIIGASLTTGYSTAGGGFFVRAVRSFAPQGTSNNDEAENRRKRQAAVEDARAVIIKKVTIKEGLSVAELQAADEPKLSSLMLGQLNKNLLSLDRTKAISYKEIAFEIAKCRIYDQIASNLNGRVHPRALAFYGVIDASYPMKSLALSRLMNLPISERDSVEEIDKFLSSEAARNAALKSRVRTLLR